MKNAVYRRCATGAAALALALALGSAGCGSAEHKSSAASQVPGRATSEASGTAQKKAAPRVLTQDQLERAVVDERDLPGLSSSKTGVGTDGVGDGVIKALRDSDTHPATCAPVSDAVDGGSRYTPVGSVVRISGNKDGMATLSMASYRAQDAVRVVDDLRAALKTCKAFTVGPLRVASNDVRATDDPPQGDDAVAFRLTHLMETPEEETPLEVPAAFVVIRSGTTVAVFKAIEDRDHTLPKVPTGLVTAQSKVLSTGTHGVP
ncbi:hypothetical protein [Streptomyces sp. Tue6028]|uniref:hypothetical protein n=1 Tax=Streptomyces sp. Tue6028 TaxID=2036037 RepID=UPI003D747FE8